MLGEILAESQKYWFLEICTYVSMPMLKNLKLVCKTFYEWIMDNNRWDYQTFLHKSIEHQNVVILCPYFKGFKDILEEYSQDVPTLFINHLPEHLNTLLPFSNNFEYKRYTKEYELWYYSNKKDDGGVKIIIFFDKICDISLGNIIKLLDSNDRCVIFTQKRPDIDKINTISKISSQFYFKYEELPFLMPGHSMTKFAFKHYINYDMNNTRKFYERIKPRFFFGLSQKVNVRSTESNDIVIRTSNLGSLCQCDLIPFFDMFRYVCETPTKITFHIAHATSSNFLNRLITRIYLGMFDTCGLPVDSIITYFFCLNKDMENVMIDWDEFQNTFKNDFSALIKNFSEEIEN